MKGSWLLWCFAVASVLAAVGAAGSRPAPASVRHRAPVVHVTVDPTASPVRTSVTRTVTPTDVTPAAARTAVERAVGDPTDAQTGAVTTVTP